MSKKQIRRILSLSASKDSTTLRVTGLKNGRIEQSRVQHMDRAHEVDWNGKYYCDRFSSLSVVKCDRFSLHQKSDRFFSSSKLGSHLAITNSIRLTCSKRC